MKLNVKKQESAGLGMLFFLVSEVMVFGGLICAFGVFRIWYPDAFHEASWAMGDKFGALGMLAMLVSSFTMAASIYSARNGKARLLAANLAGTLLGAAVFLTVKYIEFSGNVRAEYLWAGLFNTPELLDPQISVFFGLLFVITGLHALHVMVAAGLLCWLMSRAAKDCPSEELVSPVASTGLFWQMAVIIQVFIFCLWYLI